MRLTIDSSIFVEAVVGITHKNLCNDLLLRIYGAPAIELFEPSVLFFEFTCAVAKSSANPDTKESRHKRMQLALKICRAFETRPAVGFVHLDQEAWVAWQRELIKHDSYKAQHKTQDELFLSTAYESKATLVTLDQEMLKKPECMRGKVSVIPPYDCLQLIDA